MTKPRTFTKAEIRDAVFAAAEAGLNVRLTTQGEMEFTRPGERRKTPKVTAEDALEGWLNGSETRGAA